MFEEFDKITHLQPDRNRVIRLMSSFNEPMVAAPRHSVQQARAYICTYKEDTAFAVYVYLYLMNEKVGILYRHGDGLIPEGKCNEVEEEAIQFADTMGFIIDDLHYPRLSIAQQESLLSEIPLFIAATAAAPETRVQQPAETRENVVEEPIREASAPVQRPVTEPAAIETKPTLEIQPVSNVAPDINKTEPPKEVETDILLSKFRMRAALEKTAQNK